MAYNMPSPRIIALRFRNNTKVRIQNKQKPYTLRKYIHLTVKTELHISRPSKEMVDSWIEKVQAEINQLEKNSRQLLLF
jgi:hypothetical protein